MCASSVRLALDVQSAICCALDMVCPRRIQPLLFAIFLIAGASFSSNADFNVWNDDHYGGGTLHWVGLSALIVALFSLPSICAAKRRADTNHG